MNGADFVLMVTEPTPFGLHDLKLAVEAVRLLGIPCGLVVNRADIGDDQVFAYAREEGLPVLLTIPFERAIAEAYSRGATMVEALPEWEPKFLRLFADGFVENGREAVDDRFWVRVWKERVRSLFGSKRGFLDSSIKVQVKESVEKVSDWRL